MTTHEMTAPGNPDVRRLAQYRRALKLPEHGVFEWVNPAAGVDQPVDVSVLVTCHNYARFVGDALRSAFEAAIAPLAVEVIVLDDASTDESLACIRALVDSALVPMRVMRTWWNVGVSRARNLALARSRGEFVFILDADNTLMPDALVNLHAHARARQADAAYGPVQRVAEDGSLLDRVSDRPFDPGFLVAQGNYIDAMALFRRRALLDVGGYDVHLLRRIAGWEDYAVWLEFARKGYRVAFHHEVIGRYLLKSGSMLQTITTAEIARARALFVRRYRGLIAGPRRSRDQSTGT